MKRATFIILLCYACFTNLNACSCVDFEFDLPIFEIGSSLYDNEYVKQIPDIYFLGIVLSQEQIYLEGNYKMFKMIIASKQVYNGDPQETFEIYTPWSSDMCGFYAPINSEVIIAAYRQENGKYYTFRSDCVKTISKELEPSRFNKYLEYLESIQYLRDGIYNFKQSESFWRNGSINSFEDRDLANFEIKNGKFHGNYNLISRDKKTSIKGNFKNGKKEGLWEFITEGFDDYEYAFKMEEVVYYKKGKQFKSISTFAKHKLSLRDH